MTVYVDVLIFINTALNYIILLTAEKLLKRDVRALRLLAGSFVGALFSLSIFIKSGGLPMLLGIRAVSSVCITLTAFGYGSRRGFIKSIMMIFSVSFLYSGGIILFYQLFKPPDMLIYNDVMYLRLNPLILLAVTAVIYLFLLVMDKLFFERIKNTVVKLSFTVSGTAYSCIGKIDTGCNLTEPFSSSPVIIVDRSVIVIPNEPPARIIPYTALGNSSFLYGIKADSVTIDKTEISKTIYIACAEIHDKNFQAIINSDILR